MASHGREEREEEVEAGETVVSEGLGADRRVEVKNASDDGVPPTAACPEEEGPGPGLVPEMSGTSILCAAAGPIGNTPPPHCIVHFSQDLNLHCDAKFSSVLMSCHN